MLVREMCMLCRMTGMGLHGNKPGGSVCNACGVAFGSAKAMSDHVMMAEHKS